MRQVTFKILKSDLLSILMIVTMIATLVLVWTLSHDKVLERYNPNQVVMPTWPISEDEYRALFVPESPGPKRENSGEIRNPEWNQLAKGKPTVDGMPRNPDGTPNVDLR